MQRKKTKKHTQGADNIQRLTVIAEALIALLEMRIKEASADHFSTEALAEKISPIFGAKTALADAFIEIAEIALKLEAAGGASIHNYPTEQRADSVRIDPDDMQLLKTYLIRQRQMQVITDAL